MLYELYTAIYVGFISMNENTSVVTYFSSDMLFCRCATTDSFLPLWLEDIFYPFKVVTQSFFEKLRRHLTM